jgi:hypothetical protein
LKSPPTTDNSSGKHQAGDGERLAVWAHQGRLRAFTVDTLALLDIFDADEALGELDRQIDASKRSLRQARRQLVLAIYPWLFLAPLGFLIGFQSRSAIRRSHREQAPPNT